MTRIVAIITVTLAVACGTGSGVREPAPAPDPYDAYLANTPAGQAVLTPEDAQARAYLGCGTTWAPGTIDRALADAYRPGICQ